MYHSMVNVYVYFVESFRRIIKFLSRDQERMSHVAPVSRFLPQLCYVYSGHHQILYPAKGSVRLDRNGSGSPPYQNKSLDSLSLPQFIKINLKEIEGCIIVF